MAAYAQQGRVFSGIDAGARLAPLLLFSIFVALYSIYPNNYPHHDELYHVLAGASWAADGRLALGDGIYRRTPLYTILIGELFGRFGVSLPVARLPAVIASSLCVTLIYLVVRQVAGRFEAAVAAIGLGLCPLFVDIAKMARFYAFHTLLFMLGVFAIHHACTAARRVERRAAAFAVGIAALLGALYFQLTTLVGSIGLGLWAVSALALQILGLGRRLIVAAAALAGILALGLLVAAMTGLLAEALEAYRRTAPWAADRARYERFYLDLLLSYYPVLLALFPIAALYALPRYPALTSLSLAVFCIGLVLHTFAGMKAERYVTYLMPFFWIVVGLASGPVLGAMRSVVAAGADVAAMPLVRCLPARALRPAARAIGIGSLLGLGAILLAVPDTLAKLKHRVDHPVPEWGALAEALDLDDGTVLVTANPLHALYFVGDFDAELGPAVESAISQAGRPLVTDAATLERIVRCNPSGALVADSWRWSNPGVVAAALRSYAERHLRVHPAGAELNLEIYVWHHPGPTETGCAGATFGRPPPDGR